MLSVVILTVGKNKESWLKEALAEYERRLKPYVEVEWRIVRDQQTLQEQMQSLNFGVVLDSAGKTLDSKNLSLWVETLLEQRGSRLTFVIGGPDGFAAPPPSRLPLLSLSKLTLTHQIARLVLLEQLYRATQIWRGTPYHK